MELVGTRQDRHVSHLLSSRCDRHVKLQHRYTARLDDHDAQSLGSCPTFPGAGILSDPRWPPLRTRSTQIRFAGPWRTGHLANGCDAQAVLWAERSLGGGNGRTVASVRSGEAG